MLKFDGAQHFRHRLLLATLSGKAIVIKDIRSEDENPGLREFEASFLRLLDKLTNGSKIVINVTGTAVSYKPGIIVGGKITHDCGTARPIGYFLEGIIGLAPFSKQPFQVTLNGITNGEDDLAVDTIRSVTIPILKQFGVEDDLQLKINKRGAPPNGGGEVFFKSNPIRAVKTVAMVDPGVISRVRGVVYTTRMSPTTANRVVDGAREVLSSFLKDIYIYTDHYKGADTGLSPGFGLTLAAESSTGCLMSTDGIGGAGELPEELGKKVATALLAEILNNGCVDTAHQWLPLLLISLAPEDVGKIRLGKLTPYTIEFLRLLREFFGLIFKIDADTQTNTVLLTAVGIGYTNVAKKVQ